MRSIVTEEVWQIIHPDGETMVHYEDPHGESGYYPIFETKKQAKEWAKANLSAAWPHRIVRSVLVRANRNF